MSPQNPIKGIQNHYVAAFGDRTQALTEAADDRNIEVVRLDHVL